MVPQLQQHLQTYETLSEPWEAVHQAVWLPTLILAAFRVAFAVACLVVEEVLNQRDREVGEQLFCPECGTPLESRGLVSRTMKSLIGVVTWKRRAWRCPRACQVGLVAP